MRGRPPKPTHLKLVTGNPGHRPLNGREPIPTSAPPPAPPHLSGEALAEWRRIISELAALGMVTGIDAGALATMCQDYGTHVDAVNGIRAIKEKNPGSMGLVMLGANGTLVANPLVGIARRAAAGYLRAAAEFGMTPSARSRIAAGEQGADFDIAAKYFT